MHDQGRRRRTPTDRPIPTVEQAHQLADAIQPRVRLAVLLAAFVGLRKGELLGLQRRDVDFEKHELRIERQRQLDRHGQHLVGPPKTDAGRRTLALPASLADEIRHHLDTYAQGGDDGYLFTGRTGVPLAPHVLHAAWDKARHEVGVGHLHFHDLRHLAATLAASTGASTKELMYRYGHASHQAALRYQHATKERDRAIAEAVDHVIDRGRGL